MKITFLSPHIGISGGVKIIFEYANRLGKRGHKVTVVSLYPKSMKKNMPHLQKCEKYERAGREHPVKWFDLSVPLRLGPSFSAESIPDGDAVIATAWRTANDVNAYPSSKGKKFYFIQSYETWDGPKELVDRTWTMPMRKIVIASWLKSLATEKFNQQTSDVITNPIDFEQLYCSKKKRNNPKRIGMLFHPGAWKGTEDAKQAFKLAKTTYPDMDLVMFGAKPDPEWPDLKYEWHYRPSPERLREIYCSCDIWLCGSLTEGSALPPAESMACKCALVTTDIGGVRDYAIHGKTALLSPPKNPEALASNLLLLIKDEKEMKRISAAGYKMIRRFTWDKALDKFEHELHSAPDV